MEPYFLDTQFRAHPKLMEWVAGSIYEGRLQSRSASVEWGGLDPGAGPVQKQIGNP